MKIKHIFFLVLFVLIFVISTFFSFYSDKSRIDIVNVGSPKNSIEILESEKADFYRHEDANYNSQSITIVTVPNNIFYKKYNLKMKVVGDGNLKIYFKAPKYQKNNLSTVNPYQQLEYSPNVDYKNVSVNNKIVDKKFKKCSHNKSTIYEMKVNNGDIVDLSFSTRLNQKIDANFFSYFLIPIFFILICVIFNSGKFKDKNIIDEIVAWYRNINPVYRLSFWTVFVVMNIVFAFHTINFMWGNHDWIYAFDQLKIYSELTIGRYGAHLFKSLFLTGKYLPVFNNILSFFCFSLTAIFLSVYWKLPKKASFLIICGLLLTIQPFILEWLYYTTSMPEFAILPSLIIFALILSEKYNIRKRDNLIPWIAANVFAIVLINLAMATYPSVINTVLVVLAGKMFIESLEYEDYKICIKELFVKFANSFFNIFVAALSFKIILSLLVKFKIAVSNYTIDTISLADIPKRICLCIKASFDQLYFYPFEFIPNAITVLFTILIILLLFMVLTKPQKFSMKILQIGILMIALFATKTAALLADAQEFFVPRIDFFGLLYFRVLVVTALFILIKKVSLENIVVAITSIIIFVSAVNDFNALRVWKLGFDAEKMMWNRILARVEAQSNFDMNKKYGVIVIGRNIPMREKFTVKSNKKMLSYGMTKHPYNPDFVPFIAEKQYYPVDFVKYGFNIIYSKLFLKDEYIADMKKLNDAGVFDRLKGWPSPDSLIIYDDVIVFLNDDKDLPIFKEKLQEILEK